MKKKILLLVVLLFSLGICYSGETPANTPTTTPDAAKIKLLEKQIDSLKAKNAQQPTAAAANATAKANTTCYPKDLSFGQKLFVIMPELLLILLVLFLFLNAEKVGYIFKQAFFCEEPETKTELVPTTSTTVTTTFLDKNNMPLYYPSSSRLIAFLSALTSFIVIVCLLSYFAYCMMKGYPSPDFKNLMEVFLGLGLGIIPYGLNRLTAPTKTS